MTVSNFNWTDKDSVKWFILGPLGHIGPYSLHQLKLMLEGKKVAGEVKIWAEGLAEAVLLKEALHESERPSLAEVDTPPDLPPIPEEEIPPVPFENESSVPETEPPEVVETEKETRKIPAWAFIIFAIFLMGFFAFSTLISRQEKIDIHRMSKMGQKLHKRIITENPFAGWKKKIFFKEYLPQDHSHVWLVTASFHQCDVEANFTSLDGKLLTMEDEKVSFSSKGKLDDHIVEFSSMDFTQGNKIIPGMYEMDVKASHCEWNGFLANVMNRFQGPEKEYLGRTKVVLFSKGAVEFNKILDNLIKKKQAIELRKQNENDLFWQDLQQKLETLQAITLQIEQHFLDFLQSDPRKFRQNVKPMIESYTKKFGSFLTSFVIENENYFKTLTYAGKGASQKKNYELMVRLTSKKIGLESMKFIEEFQAIKKRPGPKALKSIQERVKKVFSGIKQEISQKIIQVSEDRSK